MKILIVGFRGMLGSELMNVFCSDHETIGLDLPELDITQPEACLAHASALKPDVIINAAAFTRVDDCEAHEEKALLINGHGAGNLARAAAEIGSLFVHYSTDYIFDGTKTAAYLENDPPNPMSAYGRSKLLGETLTRQNCSNHLILRISWLFGEHGPNFIRTIIGVARKGNPLRVVNDQKGSPTSAKDVAFHTRLMIEAGCRNTFHLTNRGDCTWYELAAAAIEWAGIKNLSITPVPSSEYPLPAARPANSVLANARLLEDGLPLMRSWQLAAREYVEHCLASPQA
jgi:dTDP-4-dehydrorhamnose reductase